MSENLIIELPNDPQYFEQAIYIIHSDGGRKCHTKKINQNHLERPPKVYELKDQKLVDTMPKARRSDFQKPRGHYLKKGMARRTNNPHDDDMEIATPNLIHNNIWSIPESNPLDDIFPLYPTSTDFTAESDFDSKWCDLSASPHISRGG